MNKKKILFVNESSFLSSGYATYGKNILTALHESGKYEVAELGIYGHPHDPRSNEVPWAFYANIPADKAGMDKYNSNPYNEFGAFRFDEVCLHFRPDVVLDCRDHWMTSYQLRSPARRFFKHIWVAPVDAKNQNESWLADFAQSDYILTYNDWSLKTLKEEAGNILNLVGSLGPIIEKDVFRPLGNKQEHKKACGVDPNSVIVGMVCRNQKRKLIPAFLHFASLLLAKCEKENKELFDNLYFYLHTGYPDLGWDIPRLLKEHGLGHRVLFSYTCPHCGHVEARFFADALTHCPQCSNYSLVPVNSRVSIQPKALAAIYNLFDFYVQYANSEGFGIPIAEAAACGIPTAVIDYSAMTDVAAKLGSLRLPYHTLELESETHCYRAVPDDARCAELIYAQLIKPSAILIAEGLRQRANVLQHYSLTNIKILEKTIDSVASSVNWDAPPLIHALQGNEPRGLDNRSFIEWCVRSVYGDESLLQTSLPLIAMKNLATGMGELSPQLGHVEDSIMSDRRRVPPFTRDTFKEMMAQLAEYRNQFERMRCSQQHSI